MIKFLYETVRSIAPFASVEVDDSGNMLITKGCSETYPCVVAHIDQVQKKHSDDFKAIEAEGMIIGFSMSQREQQGLGADDKNGVWIALECLKRYDTLKIAFFVGEEVGCIGSNACELSFFDNVRFVIQADRRGAHDIITSVYYTDLCSEDFLRDCGCELFGFSQAEGMLTDVYTLKERGLNVSCINLSCGYYEPHTDREFTVIEDLLNTRDFVFNVIETCTKVYPHEYVEHGYGYEKYGLGYYGSWYDGYSDYYGGIYSPRKDSKPTYYSVFDGDADSKTDKTDLEEEMYWDLYGEMLHGHITTKKDARDYLKRIYGIGRKRAGKIYEEAKMEMFNNGDIMSVEDPIDVEAIFK